jgi:hypothetical protein
VNLKKLRKKGIDPIYSRMLFVQLIKDFTGKEDQIMTGDAAMNTTIDLLMILIYVDLSTVSFSYSFCVRCSLADSSDSITSFTRPRLIFVIFLHPYQSHNSEY